MIMLFSKHIMTNCKRWILSEKGVALALATIGTLFVATGAHRFWVRPEHFGLPDLLGCVAGAFGGFFLLLLTDYLLHHARLVFIPWLIVFIFFAVVEPYLGVGLGVALWFTLASQLRN